MPRYTDSDGTPWTIPDWPGEGYKAMVINRAYRQGAFSVVTVAGHPTIFFTCGWCRRPINSAGVQGDHVAQQAAGRTLRSNDLLNLVLSCSECNGGTRNLVARQTRSSFSRARAAQAPRPVND